jgi:hypothetical protein
VIGNAFPGSLAKYHANILEPIHEQFASANGSRAHQPPTSYTLCFAAVEKVKTPFLKFRNADISFTPRPQGADLNSQTEHLCGGSVASSIAWSNSTSMDIHLETMVGADETIFHGMDEAGAEFVAFIENRGRPCGLRIS